MKRKIIALTLAGILACSVCSCGNNESEKADQVSGMESTVGGQTSEESRTETAWNETEEIPGEDTQEETHKGGTEISQGGEEGVFSFSDLVGIEFCFASGAGAWSTEMTVHGDGSFSGVYHDTDMGSAGDGYPNGTVYYCDFSGQFTQPVKINEYTFSMQIAEIDYVKEAGTEEIIDGVKYCYSEAYGLDGAKDILIYLPGAPLAELPEEFLSWVGYFDLAKTTEAKLSFYALNNEAQQYGFSSYDLVESLKERISSIEGEAASLEASIQNDALTQTEYNEKTKELYDLWDAALNDVWSVLKQTQDQETMSALTVEEREWIAAKEQAVAEAGAEYEGGSMQQMAVNQKAAELTKERVYELLELLGIEGTGA